MISKLLLSALLFFSISISAQIAESIDDFVHQIALSNGTLHDAMSSLKIDFESTSATVSQRVIDLTQTTDLANSDSPIANIHYGFVSSYTELLSGTQNPTHIAAGDDNTGMFTIEVTFKSASQMPSIHPSLAGKTVLFVAYGDAPDFKIIYTTGSTSGSGNLADAAQMSSIKGFLCFLKTKRCTSANGSIGPARSCASYSSINAGVAPGTISSGTNYVNLFSYTHGLFSLCANATSLRDTMGG